MSEPSARRLLRRGQVSYRHGRLHVDLRVLGRDQRRSPPLRPIAGTVSRVAPSIWRLVSKTASAHDGGLRC
eukprot:6755670-Alexandrium_andersonii.AAC.1